MRIITMLTLTLVSINFLTACSTNAIPETGPTMEQIYDGMGDAKQNTAPLSSERVKLRQPMGQSARMSSDMPRNAVGRSFHKLPNPELNLYVFPHLAGKDEIPVPGYFTVFNAYEQNHYVLPSEVVIE